MSIIKEVMKAEKALASARNDVYLPYYFEGSERLESCITGVVTIRVLLALLIVLVIPIISAVAYLDVHVDILIAVYTALLASTLLVYPFAIKSFRAANKNVNNYLRKRNRNV